MNKKYYSLDTPAKSAPGSIHPPKGIPFNLLKNKEFIEQWDPITSEIHDMKFPDHSSYYFSKHLFSEKIRAIFNKYPANASIQWLLVYVKNATGEQKKYYIPHFYKDENFLDKNLTEMSPSGVVALPVYSYSKIMNKSFFPSPHKRIIVSEQIKNELQNAGCTNIVFSEAPVIDDLNITDRATG